MSKISITNMEMEIEYLKKNDGMKGLSYDGISTSPTNERKSSTESIALGNMEAVAYLERLIQKAKLEIESIDRSLGVLEEVERIVLTERYISNKQWWKVAAIVCYSERHCKRIRADAVNKLAVGLYGGEIVNAYKNK